MDTKNGIFILTVDEWSLSSNTVDPNDSSNFSELNLFLNNDFVNLKPNIPYLLNYFDKKNFDIILGRKSYFFLHDDGWLEINIEMDSALVNERIERNINYYTKNYLPKWKYSDTRYKYLSKTITFLKKYGTVFFIPVTCS